MLKRVINERRNDEWESEFDLNWRCSNGWLGKRTFGQKDPAASEYPPRPKRWCSLRIKVESESTLNLTFVFPQSIRRHRALDGMLSDGRDVNRDEKRKLRNWMVRGKLGCLYLAIA
jgi:hypothetical protein